MLGWGESLQLLQQAFHRPGVHPVTKPIASKHRRNKVHHSVTILIYLCVITV